MLRINIIQFLFIKFFQKSLSTFEKFYFPKMLQKVLYNFYFKALKHVLDSYLNKSFASLKNPYYKGNTNSRIIWIFWWQGYSHMPLIVNKCINSIKCHSNHHKIVLITKNNIHKYTNIPDFILNKIKNGQITLTHFSDILRFHLLNNYGGLWCDATLYCTSNLDSSYFDSLYTSGGYHNTDPKFVDGRWTGFLIGGNQHNALFQFMCNYFNLYWKNNKYQINYFLIDLGLHYAYIHNIGNFRNYVNKEACDHNPNMFKLVDLLNKSYNSRKFIKITKNTNIFKLTYKQKFNDSGSTFYHYLVNNKL